ncbi:MAG: ATP-binding protein [Bacteroidales bacterium]|nr:ATP-binding protein [Bacteroidales bacterium]
MGKINYKNKGQHDQEVVPQPQGEVTNNSQPIRYEKIEKVEIDEACQQMFDSMVTRNFLHELSTCDVEPLPMDSKYSEVRWYRVDKIIIEKDVFFTDKLSMLYMSLHKSAKNVILVLNKQNGGDIELYLGARDFSGNSRVSGEILEAGLKGYFPGIGFKPKKGVPDLTFSKPAVSAVSAIASLRDDKKEDFVQGIERLINATSSIRQFRAYFIADSVGNREATDMINAFNQLFSSLSPAETLQMTFNESKTKGISESFTENFSETIGESISKTVTHTDGYSDNQTESETVSEGSSENYSRNIIASIWTKFFGGRTGDGKNKGSSYTRSNAIGKNFSDSEANQKGSNTNTTKGTANQKGSNKSITKGASKQITYKNRTVKFYLDILDKQLERLQNGRPFGLWSVATYFVANDPTTVQQLSNIYRGSIIGEESGLETCAVNTWTDNDKVKAIIHYLENSLHPRFDFNSLNVSAGSVVNSKELAIHLSLPQSSVPGILVREEQSFGRNVISENTNQDSNTIEIGSIMHLGEKTEERVPLGIKNLSKHTFITGTTGSGKSNTLYCLISRLIKNGKKCLVIEPAKGEYKHVFGGKEGVSVYGSNPKQTLLLHINPFEFPESIDVYQHIDSLIEVFNACWPMYAAMPQVLSHSIIEAYKNCGWDMERSFNPNKQFPIVEDVLDSLKEYINSSDYSSDTKGDYIGSLETRLQSLCDGTVGRMLRGASISNEELFNENVIVDLSQVRSMENQSLIMGLLVLKLDEFRSSEGKGMNQPLRHVTILEEAHHLLKRTSTTQNAESSNVAGMAVEKIANSMAEMRTYGEGFIIADQSPSMLDLATIRNTNTKIIMALPEKDDRETAGKSIGLDDKHIEEISRLKTGEAIVYQTGWEEAVKAKIDEYKDENEQPWKYSLPEIIVDHSKRSLKKACYSLLDCYTSYNAELNHQELLDLLVGAEIPVGRYNKAKEKLEIMSNVKTDDIAYIDSIAYIFATIVGSEIFESAKLISDTAIFNARISRALSLKLDITNNDRINGFVNMYMKGCSLMADVPFYEGWLQTTLKNK